MVSNRNVGMTDSGALTDRGLDRTLQLFVNPFVSTSVSSSILAAVTNKNDAIVVVVVAGVHPAFHTLSKRTLNHDLALATSC